MKSISLFIIGYSLMYVNLVAQPILSNVTISTTLLPVYEKLELTYMVNGSYSQPHKIDEIETYCEFYSPSGKKIRTEGFYYVQYISSFVNCTGPQPTYNCPDPVTANFSCQQDVEVPTIFWKVRFTPSEIGQWSFKLFSNDQTGSDVYPNNGTFSFIVNSSINPGFIQKANKKFLSRTTGEFFFCIGENLAYYDSPVWLQSEIYGLTEVYNYLDKLSNNGANTIRLFLDSYDSMSLIGHDYTTNEDYWDIYNQKDASHLDQIIEYCTSKNINIILVCFSYPVWTEDYGYSFNNNPFSNIISSPFDLFTDIDAKERTKQYLRYIVSRWGYSTNVIGFELWNEVNKLNETIPPIQNFDVTVKLWHDEMIQYIRQIDPHNHLVLSSYAYDFYLPVQIPDLYSCDLDIISSHIYKDLSTSQLIYDFQNHFYTASVIASNLKSPYFNTEFGHTHPCSSAVMDPKGFEIHNSLWSSSMSGACGASLIWWWKWNQYIDKYNLYTHFLPISQFMYSLKLPSEEFEPKVNNEFGLRTYYLANISKDTIYGWTQDVAFHLGTLLQTQNGNLYLNTFDPQFRPQPTSSVNKINIDVNNSDYEYIINWYDPSNNAFVKVDNVLSYNGTLTIEIPQFLRDANYGDAAFKIYLDCNKNIWRDREITNSPLSNHLNNFIYNNSGQLFYVNNSNKLNSIYFDYNLNSWEHSELNQSSFDVANNITISDLGDKIFYVNTNGGINAIWFDNNNSIWTWSNLNSSASLNVKGPICYYQDKVFYRNTSNKINAIWYDNSINSWIHSYLNFASSNDVSEQICSNDVGQIFYKTTKNDLNSLWFDHSINEWQWSNLDNSAINIVCGEIYPKDDKVYFIDCNYNIRNIYYNISTNSWLLSQDFNSNAFTKKIIGVSNNHDVYYININDNKINKLFFENLFWNVDNLNNISDINIDNEFACIDNDNNLYYLTNNKSIRKLYYKSQCLNLDPSTNYFKYIDMLNKEDSFIISPNPSKGQINIFFPYQINNFKVELYNLLGILVYTYQIDQSLHVLDINLPQSLSNGIYSLNIISSSYNTNSKIILCR